MSAAFLRTSVLVLIALVSLSIAGGEFVAIHALWTPVGFVDTWPLYDRLMKLQNGELSLDHYFLDPHVHPHAIVFLLYLIDAKLAHCLQLIPHFATLLCTIGTILMFGFVLLRCRPREEPSSFYFWLAALSTPILLCGINEATVIPFQSVVVVTRFIYIALLLGLTYAQFKQKPVLHGICLALSAIAVSFYASAGVFALLILVLHVLFFRRWKWLLASTIPLISYVMLIKFYTHESDESHALLSILHSISFDLIEKMVLGVFAYYSSVILQAWPAPPGIGEVALLISGALVFCISIIWAVVTLGGLLLRTIKNQAAVESQWPLCLVALLSVWVAISAVSASLLWLARAQILPGVFTQPVYQYVFTSTRYAAFACLAFSTCLMVLARLPLGALRLVPSVALFTLVSWTGAQSLTHEHLSVNFQQRQNEEVAATALLIGMPFTTPQVSDALWQGIDQNWYWPTELLRIVPYLKASGYAYAHGMPDMGSMLSRLTDVPISYSLQPIDKYPSICAIKGLYEADLPSSILAPKRFYPLVDAKSSVVGYAVATRQKLEGYVSCPSADDEIRMASAFDRK